MHITTYRLILEADLGVVTAKKRGSRDAYDGEVTAARRREMRIPGPSTPISKNG